MERVVLGRTGLSASVMGLGCGGHSRLGLATGKSEANAIQIVRRAVELGVNFIDTAESYGTEVAVGKAISNSVRSSVILSTKLSSQTDSGVSDKLEFKARAEGCLQRLQTDCLDILHVHGVSPEEYPYVAGELVPALLELRQEGKIRFLGITEAFIRDTTHQTLGLALEDDCWDVMMAGFNLLNQSARERVFLKSCEKNIGILCMFAVRRALSDPAALDEVLRTLVSEGSISPDDFDAKAPLDFLLESGIAGNIPEAAYRFCRFEPGIHTVLSGTGDLAHLEENVTSLSSKALPEERSAQLKHLFRRVDSVSGN